MAKKYVYLFSEGNAKMREILGGKGANLAEMTNLGLPVPQGFTISTEACTQYYEDGKKINSEIESQIMEYIGKMEKITGKKFGDMENPLLVSVRSGARASMPGMMDTILNLGLNEEVVDVIAKKSNNPRWAWDCYRRFIQMYSDVVMEVGKKYFEELIDKMKEKKGVTLDVELSADDLKELAREFKEEYKAKIGKEFPTDPKEQLMGAIMAVFRSWDNPRANYYRMQNDIPYSWGTAVNVQMMVFGNMGDTSGTGVAFTRDPATGEKKLMGEFLMNAQGEDVVAGVRTPMPIAKMQEVMPEVYAQFNDICKTLENHYKDMQDMEFTIEDRKLYMLQTRNGKRTARAAIKIACDLIDEGMITEKEALMQKCGVLYQSGALFSSMTLAENIALPLEQYTDYSKKTIRDMVSLKLALVGLKGFEDFYPSEISGGMKKRAGLARALALDPQIVYFDEPSAGLDPVSSKLLDDLIIDINQCLGTTIVIVTHELSSIFNIGTNSIFLDVETKTISARGNPKDLLKNPPNKNVYNFLTRGGISHA